MTAGPKRHLLRYRARSESSAARLSVSPSGPSSCFGHPRCAAVRGILSQISAICKASNRLARCFFLNSARSMPVDEFFDGAFRELPLPSDLDAPQTMRSRQRIDHCNADSKESGDLLCGYEFFFDFPDGQLRVSAKPLSRSAMSSNNRPRYLTISRTLRPSGVRPSVAATRDRATAY